LPLPLVVPVVLHHSEKGWTAPRQLEALFDRVLVSDPELAALVPRLSFILDDISHLSDDELSKRALGAAVTLGLWALRDSRKPERLLASLPHFAGMITELLRAPSGRDAVLALFLHLYVVAEVPPGTFHDQIQIHAPEAKEFLMTIAEQLQAKGRDEGRAEAKAADILAVLEARQKAVTAEQRAKIEGCRDLAVLDRWLRRAVTLSDPRELFEQPE
jgi:hypothetical protein